MVQPITKRLKQKKTRRIATNKTVVQTKLKSCHYLLSIIQSYHLKLAICKLYSICEGYLILSCKMLCYYTIYELSTSSKPPAAMQFPSIVQLRSLVPVVTKLAVNGFCWGSQSSIAGGCWVGDGLRLMKDP